MNYSKFLNYTGPIIIIVWAILKILHWQVVNLNILFSVGMAFTFLGIGLKTLIAKRQTRSQKSNNSSISG